MAGLTLADLPLPPRGYRPSAMRDRGSTMFERLSDSMSRDEDRAARLLRSLPALDADQADHVFDLRNRLLIGVNDQFPPRSLASSLYMRDVRNRTAGNLSYLADTGNVGPMAMVTLRPADMIVHADDLDQQSPALLMKRLRNDLTRAGIIHESGILFAGLDSEFDVNRAIHDFHFHMMVSGDKVDALERLRAKPKYIGMRRDPREAGLPSSPRVHIIREPFRNPIDLFTYTLKSYAKHRPTTRRKDGSLERSKKHYAIPDPHHARWLLWMDRWSIGDVTMLSGMRVGKEGFQIISRCRSEC